MAAGQDARIGRYTVTLLIQRFLVTCDSLLPSLFAPFMIVGYHRRMTDVTQILNAIEQGDPSASEKLLPLVYKELRVLASQRLTNEKPGQTLQATALVHEAYLRLVGNQNDQSWDNRGHFFAAAAEAMRRILVDIARRKQSLREGGNRNRVDLNGIEIESPHLPSDLLEINEALSDFEKIEPEKAKLIKLRYFAGMTIPEASQALGISTATAERHWAYARAWLHTELNNA